MSSMSMIREAAALRHAFQTNGRLQLEFLADLSKLLREHKVTAADSLIGNLILAVPDELMNGMYAATKAGKKSTKVKPPQSSSKVKPPQTPEGEEVKPPQTPTKKSRVKPPQSAKKKSKVKPPQAVVLPPQTPSKRGGKR